MPQRRPRCGVVADVRLATWRRSDRAASTSPGSAWAPTSFGWTADRDTSFAVLDAYVGGGRQLRRHRRLLHVAGPRQLRRRVRDDHRRVDRGPRQPRRRRHRHEGRLAARAARACRAPNIAAAVEDSLRRLQTDRIDLYYAHNDDPDTAQEETLDAFDALVRAGKVRAIGGVQLHRRSGCAVGAGDLRGATGWPPTSRCSRTTTSSSGPSSRPSCRRCSPSEGLSCMPYYGLAKGFLTGKYRAGGADGRQPARAEGAPAYLDDRGLRVLAVLDEVAAGARRAGRGRRAGLARRRSRRSRRRSPAPAPPSSWPTCCRCWT